MEELITKYQPVRCARCEGSFTCKAGNISQCDCMEVTITRDEQSYISLKFADCVCNKCLKELKYDYYLAEHHNKPFHYDL